jgi:hypothetical protein
MSESSPSEKIHSSPMGTDETTESKLYALIQHLRGKRAWPEQETKAAEHLMATLLNTSSTDGQIDSLLSLASDLPLPVVEAVFINEWQAIEAEKRQRLIRQLVKQTSDKMQTRQAAIAERIAHQDTRGAAYILQGFLLTGKRGKDHEFWPQLTKEKKELLRSRFGHKKWVDFNEPDENLMRVLLAGFTEAMSDSDALKNKRSQRPVFDFAKWALSTLQLIRLSDADRNLVTRKLSEITEEFPQEWKNELAALAGPMIPSGARAEPQSAALCEQAENPFTSEPSYAGRDVTTQLSDSQPSVLLRPNPTSEKGVDLNSSLAAAISSLIERRLSEETEWHAFIENLQTNRGSIKGDVELLRRIVEELENNHAVRNNLESELKEAKLKSEGLEVAISRLESELGAAHKTLVATQDDCRMLADQKLALQTALDDEKRLRASERDELEQDIERTASTTLEGFKAQLTRSLRPIFLNKRTTDDQEPSSRLSEFLRSWFAQIEQQLKAMGVDISKDS